MRGTHPRATCPDCFRSASGSWTGDVIRLRQHRRPAEDDRLSARSRAVARSMVRIEDILPAETSRQQAERLYDVLRQLWDHGYKDGANADVRKREQCPGGGKLVERP